MERNRYHKFNPDDEHSFFRFSGRIDKIHLCSPETNKLLCGKPGLSSNYAEYKEDEPLCEECEKKALEFNQINNDNKKANHDSDT